MADKKFITASHDEDHTLHSQVFNRYQSIEDSIIQRSQCILLKRPGDSHALTVVNIGKGPMAHEQDILVRTVRSRGRENVGAALTSLMNDSIYWRPRDKWVYWEEGCFADLPVEGFFTTTLLHGRFFEFGVT